jgi:hypothetical protein
MRSALAIPLGALAVATLLTAAAFYGARPEAFQFPKLIGAAMIVLSLFMVADVVLRRRAGVVSTVEAEPFPLGRMWPAFAVMAGYLLVLERLGFYTSAFAAFLVLTTIYARAAPFDPLRLLLRAVYGGLFVATLYVVFALVLRAQLPAGLLP